MGLGKNIFWKLDCLCLASKVEAGQFAKTKSARDLVFAARC